MLKIQAERTPAQAERAKEDADISVFRLADALGSPAVFTEEAVAARDGILPEDQ